MSVPVRGTDDDESRALSPMSTVSRSPATAQASDATRWGQLIFGIICMVMIANLQYGWTLFVIPIDQKYHWGRPAIQVAFTIFVLTETWLVPFEGYLIDRFGPRVMICGSGALVAIAWVINSVADSLFLLYVGAAIGGIGAGVIYGGSVGNALKWFPDRRGLAAGLTAAGFGADSVLTIIPIASMIQMATKRPRVCPAGQIRCACADTGTSACCTANCR
jgi:MFS transporter, OFA family, oxalate/formate antiporter